MTAGTGSAPVSTVGERPNVLVLEGPLRWDYHEGWSIGDDGDVLQEMWFKWPETSSGEGPHGSFRITIERLE